MSSNIKLLPCPFCNNAKIAINNENPKDNSGGYFIECPGCGASTSLRFACGDDPIRLLAEQWNRRATSHCLHQIQEPATAEQAGWHAFLHEGRAQAPQPDDMRDKVTLALGLSLTPKGAPAFAWSYLLDSIRELVKCEEELVLLKAGLEMTHPAPAAVAVPEALELLKLYRKLCGSDYARHHSTHLKRIDNAIAALAVTPAAAAPVALPETESAIRQVMNLVSDWGIADFMAAEARLDAASSDANQKELDEAEKRIKAAQVARRAIETKLRALLAGGSTPAAQAVEPTDAELIALNAGECYFGESPSKYPELGHGTQYHAGAPGVLGFARAALALRSDPAAYSQKFQQRVQPWMMACFGPEISADRIERNHRFLEESLELVQSCGCTASEAHQLVDYVFGRPVGEPAQETGGVMVTLAALCLASGLDMHACGETELARIWTKVEAIRTKQAAKPKHSPLPMHVPQAQADARDANQVIGDLAYALDMLVGANASHSLCEQEPMDAMGRVKGTWSKAAECNAQSTLEIHRAAIAAAKGEDQ